MRAEIEQNLKAARRTFIKPATETHLATKIETVEFEEIIVRDIARMDEFPNIDKHGVGISGWFKVDVAGFYDRGIEVFLSGSGKVIQTEDGWRLLRRGEGSESAIYARLFGQIPFEFIERIDWSRSDPYYFAPHFYCRFSGPLRGPYEAVIYKAKLYPSVSEDYCEIGLREESYEWGIWRRGALLFRQGVSRYWQRVMNLGRRPTL